MEIIDDDEARKRVCWPDGCCSAVTWEKVFMYGKDVARTSPETWEDCDHLFAHAEQIVGDLSLVSRGGMIAFCHRSLAEEEELRTALIK